MRLQLLFFPLHYSLLLSSPRYHLLQAVFLQVFHTFFITLSAASRLTYSFMNLVHLFAQMERAIFGAHFYTEKRKHYVA